MDVFYLAGIQGWVSWRDISCEPVFRAEVEKLKVEFVWCPRMKIGFIEFEETMIVFVDGSESFTASSWVDFLVLFLAFECFIETKDVATAYLFVFFASVEVMKFF